jgi:hypothetical protein
VDIAELVTVVAIIAGVGGILITMAVFTWQMVSSTNRFDAKLDRLDAKIEAQGKDLEGKIEAQGKELTAEIREMGERFSRKVTDVEIEQARLNAINEIMLDDRHTHHRGDD